MCQIWFKDKTIIKCYTFSVLSANLSWFFVVEMLRLFSKLEKYTGRESKEIQISNNVSVWISIWIPLTVESFCNCNGWMKLLKHCKMFLSIGEIQIRLYKQGNWKVKGLTRLENIINKSWILVFRLKLNIFPFYFNFNSIFVFHFTTTVLSVFQNQMSFIDYYQ